MIMVYYVHINKKVRNVRSYILLKRTKESTNVFSRFMQNIFDKYIFKNKEA